MLFIFDINLDINLQFLVHKSTNIHKLIKFLTCKNNIIKNKFIT